jgi:hypothetical protein
LISPGITTSAGPRLALLVYSTSLYAAWSAAALAFSDVELPALGEGLPKLGSANGSLLHGFLLCLKDQRALLQ